MADTSKPDYYTGPQAGDFAAADEPFALFEAWLEDATSTSRTIQMRMALATVDADGLPNVRMVLLKGVDQPIARTRFRLLHQLRERQGPRAAGRPQSRALLPLEEPAPAGARARTGDAGSAAEADAYFATAHVGSRIGAWASRSSRGRWKAALRWRRPSRSIRPNTLVGDVPRPPYWSGFPRRARSRSSSGTDRPFAAARAHHRSGAPDRRRRGSRRAFIPERNRLRGGAGPLNLCLAALNSGYAATHIRSSWSLFMDDVTPCP